MSYQQYKEPFAIEQLIFQVKEEAIELFLQMDHQIWTEALSTYPGFSKKEIWISEKNKGRIMTIIYWDSLEEWKAIPHDALMKIQNQFDKTVGSDKYQYIGCCHDQDQMYKVSDYKPPIRIPQAIEQLIFQVEESVILDFIKYDEEIWTEFLQKQPGFISKEIWISESKKGEITTVTYWKSLEAWKAVDTSELARNEALFEKAVGKNNYELIMNNVDNQRYRVSNSEAR